MPAFVAGALEEGGAANDGAQDTAIDHGARLLVRAAEKGIGGRTDAQPRGIGRVEQFAPFGEGDAKRLFGIDVLAGGQAFEANIDMGPRDGEIDHEVDGRIGQQFIDTHRLEAKFGGAGTGGVGAHVGETLHIESAEAREPVLAQNGLQIGR